MRRLGTSGSLRSAAVASVGAALVLAAACSASHSSPHSSPSSSPPLSRSVLAARYLAVAAVGNRGLDHAFDALDGPDRDDLGVARADLRSAVVIERSFDRELLQIPFPPDLLGTARTMARANESRATLTAAAAGSTSLTRLRAAERRMTAANGPVETQVKALRRQLGLPPPDSD